jgi:hypothetical protein
MFPNPIEMFEELREDYWHVAFKNGKHCKVMKNGIYHAETDSEWLLMFCGFSI